MAFQDSMQRGASKFSLIIGKGMMYGGGAGLLVMACVGTVAIDIVLLAYAEKRHNQFMTGFILGSMFWGPRIDPVPLLIASPITSAIAVVLSFALGVSGVGFAILGGWALSATLFTLGYGLQCLAEASDPDVEPEPARMAFA
jgi:hypothetical protein